MIPGTPEQARWWRAAPRHSVPAEVLDRILDAALPGCRVLAAERLGDGKRNANFKLHLDAAPETVVLRVYEHDPSLCRKEIDLIRLVAGAVPVADVIYAAPRGWEDLPPVTVTRWVEGITFVELKRSGDVEAIAQAAQAAGKTLAAIGGFQFPRPGWITHGPAVTAPLMEGADPIPHFVDQCLASENLQRRMGAELRESVHDAIWRWAPRLTAFDCEMSLVHGDFNRRNLVMRRAGGRWVTAAVLDWEFAVSGCPLADVGSFLRYERDAQPVVEPHLSAGYAHAGGRLPQDWRRLSRLIDLAALVESLTHDELPEDVTAELVGLVRDYAGVAAIT